MRRFDAISNRHAAAITSAEIKPRQCSFGRLDAAYAVEMADGVLRYRLRPADNFLPQWIAARPDQGFKFFAHDPCNVVVRLRRDFRIAPSAGKRRQQNRAFRRAISEHAARK